MNLLGDETLASPTVSGPNTTCFRFPFALAFRWGSVGNWREEDLKGLLIHSYREL